MQVRVIAVGIVLALTLAPLGTAQETILSHTNPSTRQLSEDQLPDSPGTVQARPSQPQQIALAQADSSQVPDAEQAASSQAPNAATDTAAPDTSSPQSSAPQSDTQSNNQVPETPSQSEQSTTQPAAQSQQPQQQQ